MSESKKPKSPIGVEDHWVTLVLTVATVVGISLFFHLEFYWLLVIGMFVSALSELILKGIPKDGRENRYWFMHKFFKRDRTQQSHDRTPVNKSQSDKLETLRERYAEGELTEEQFEHEVDKFLGEDIAKDIERVEKDNIKNK